MNIKTTAAGAALVLSALLAPAAAHADIDWSCHSSSYSYSICEGSGTQYQNGHYVYYSLVSCDFDRWGGYTCTGYADGQHFRVTGS